MQLSWYFKDFCPISIHRNDPKNSNEAILVVGDTGGSVNAFLFSSVHMALFDRPHQPAGETQGKLWGFENLGTGFKSTPLNRTYEEVCEEIYV